MPFHVQDIIRAYVTQDHSSILMKPPTLAPSLEIKLPLQTEGQREKTSLELQTEESGEKGSLQASTPVPDVNSEEEDDDDWDAFQSFPASRNEAASDSKMESAAEESTLAENFTAGFDNKDDDFQIDSASESFNNVKDVSDEDNEETKKEKMLSDELTDTNKVGRLHHSGTNCEMREDSASQSCNQVKESIDEGQEEISKEVITDALDNANESQDLADLGPAKDDGDLGVNLGEDQQQSNAEHVNVNETQASSHEISGFESHGKVDDKTDGRDHQESSRPLHLPKSPDEPHRE